MGPRCRPTIGHLANRPFLATYVFKVGVGIAGLTGT